MECTEHISQLKLIPQFSNGLFQQTYTPADLQLMLDLLELVELHFKVEREPGFYASRLCVTLWVLNPLCKLYFGRTVYGLVMGRVLQEAKMLLRLSLMSSKLIAFELGFSDGACFSRFFLRETGVRPGSFRSFCLALRAK